ncbi:hypothetical protein J3Q64DRAFT_1733305 [Phycomyces blakesleeanus]|uniref:Histidine-specific methyltransferase SAM-dependent domain-containing protein n=2 Tax=Phycomyces blakesleeanus TaxID=4837 RepID=A0A163D9B9_PHYB8|nr:hypothetical protein PHYBLDRAFT_127007 [Phycomyces blakesleeanus NRRL 1555(-)]OAD69710.1 hypothetical protein PHYBLDRAFT_127007 [Phycomyces blakesleeanus NRRL 1555(-)]|eukprot:XP_018287750.1 hypothetical protein PHYBLDRAFT_127007 [Phycomyces blakesleeanus NRRL 1555(-)]
MLPRSLSPSTYELLDIRAPDHTTLKKSKEAPLVGRPPSPPSSEASLDVFSSAELANTILEGLRKPTHKKSISTFVLYDNRGLNLFDKITYQEDYYLTNAELDILQQRADELADRLHDGSVLIELGAGALRKTQLVLQAIERKKLRVTYYALDLDQHELERSLGKLGEFCYVKLMGLLGTYDQGIPWLSEHFKDTNTHKAIMWLGSSIGNQNRRESAIFLRRLQRTCLQPGDICVIGFDLRNDPAKIQAAYDDKDGITREFILNGLDHVNAILGQNILDRKDFAYDSRYQTGHGRHVAHYRALRDMGLVYHSKSGDVKIELSKDELIHIEHSYKYSLKETTHILESAELNMLENWTDSKHQYRLVVAECRPFSFGGDRNAIIHTLFPPENAYPQDVISCDTCNDTGIDPSVASNTLPNLVGPLHWPEFLPSLYEWEQLWKSWDTVTAIIRNQPSMLHEKPIKFRHPCIFYLGHIPAFLDIQLSRNAIDQDINPEHLLTEPAVFADIFERGIDPDMDDPSKCNPHSTVPTEINGWPLLDDIMTYQKAIRARLERLLISWEVQFQTAGANGNWPSTVTKRKQRIMHMTFEHEAMHLETLLYMLVQSPNVRPPPGVGLPDWKMAEISASFASQFSAKKCLDSAPMLEMKAGSVVLGHEDDESSDWTPMDGAPVNALESTTTHGLTSFGWDNEHPCRVVRVSAFSIQSRPVTNGEYLAKLGNRPLPESWGRIAGQDVIGVKTVFGLCPMKYCMDWPVQVSAAEAEVYASLMGMRLPTEAELVMFRKSAKSERIPNIGFGEWSPTALRNDEIHIVGDVWELTGTILESHEGYNPSTIYLGYSSDFLDGKHRVVLGGSWATHPRISCRETFRNWYQASYPFVFSGFRLCRS